MDRSNAGFRYILEKLGYNFSEVKLKKKPLNVPFIRKLIQDSCFEMHLNVNERNAWQSFVGVYRIFFLCQ